MLIQPVTPIAVIHFLFTVHAMITGSSRGQYSLYLTILESALAVIHECQNDCIQLMYSKCDE